MGMTELPSDKRKPLARLSGPDGRVPDEMKDHTAQYRRTQCPGMLDIARAAATYF